MPSLVTAAETNIDHEIKTIQQLSEVASQHPYYKFNYAWTRQMQDVVSTPFTSQVTFGRN